MVLVTQLVVRTKGKIVNMKDIIQFLYTDFILRDIFGYVLPGAVVFVAVLYFFCHTDIVKTIIDKDLLLWKHSFVLLLVVPLFYLIGHSVSGVAFNIVDPNPIYSYYPYNGDIKNNTDFMQHKEEFVNALGTLASSAERLNKQDERLVVLKQLTGTGSAACLIALFILFLSFLKNSKDDNMESKLTFKMVRIILIPMLLFLAGGLWAHHDKLRNRQISFELSVIKEAEEAANNGYKF